MKLKLEAKDGVTILAISESISAEHLAVLKAGLTKLFQAAKKTVLLDLTSPTLTMEQAEVIELSSLREWSALQSAALMIASPLEGLGDAPSREECIKLMSSELGKLMMLESRLRSQFKELEARKASADQSLAQAAKAGADLKTLRKENGDLKARIADLEKQLQHRLDHRAPAFETPLGASRMETTAKVLVSILEQEGVLPVR